MSSKKTKLVPKLRFPEFKAAEEWKAKTLREVCLRITNGKANAEDHEEGGAYPLFDRSAVIKRSNAFMFDSEAVILPGEGMRFIPKYFDGKFNLHQRAYALMEHQGNARFVYYSLDYLKDLLAKKAVKSTVLSLRLPIVENFLISFPPVPEQQKIADCLSSLDELIAAQARKVDALKTHKKGLMQQLFPREGETQPRLRFPEFLSAKSWKSGNLISLSNAPLSNGVFNDPKKVGSGYKLINVSDMYIDTVVDEDMLSLVALSPSEFVANQVKYGDIFFTRSSLVKSGIAVSNIYLGSSADVTFDGHLIRFRPDTQKVFPLFSHYLFKTSLVRQQLIARGKTATMTTIGQGDVASVTLLWPEKKEQQRIADCLTSLDDLITAATQELDTLKTHKKGLMQQLFPSAETVEA